MVLDINTYKEKQKEVSELRTKLTEVNDRKETWFKKKEDLKKEINDYIQKVKEVKAAKEKNHTELQQLKEQRDKHNNEVHTLIKKIKTLYDEKSKVYQKYNVSLDPKKLQEKINELESKVEIEVNFEKEKKLMEEIKKLKKTYEQSAEVASISDTAESLERDIKESRKRADEFHKRIQELTKDTSYQVFIEISKKINALKKEQEDAFQKFIDCKNEYSSLNKELKNRQDELNVLRTIFHKDKEAKKVVIQEKQKQILEDKAKKVEEKLRTKKKLTTEDIIAMQGLNDEASS